MAETLSSISKASTIEEIGEFWDDHSLDEFWDQTEEAEFEVRAPARRRVALEPEVYGRVKAVAQQRGVSPETLVNLWLVEQLQMQGAD